MWFGQNHIAAYLKAIRLTYYVLGMTSLRLWRTDIMDTQINVIQKCETSYGRAKTRRGQAQNWEHGEEVGKKWQRGRHETRQPCDSPQTRLRVEAGVGGGGSVNWTAETLPARSLDDTAVLWIRAFGNYQHQTYVSQILNSGVSTNKDNALSPNTLL